MTTYHWLAAFIAVNIIDAVLTLYALKLGASELNPLMRLAMRLMPAPVALLAVKGAYIIAVGAMLNDVAPWLPLPGRMRQAAIERDAFAGQQGCRHDGRGTPRPGPAEGQRAGCTAPQGANQESGEAHRQG